MNDDARREAQMPSGQTDGVGEPEQGRGPVVIGLTGPIGCGKSSVAGMLADLGGLVIDADELVRVVTAPGEPAAAAVRERFGDAVFHSTGVLDRAVLAKIVFDDPAALAALEAIVHPHVRALVEVAIQRARQAGDPFVAMEAIKLIEGGLAKRCDEVWLIECAAADQRSRLEGRGMAAADIERRVKAQGADLAERLALHADRRIDTSGTLESLRERVEDALAEVLAPRFAGLPWGPVERR
ncbi:MAG: dephospho-CoA kinase [Chloroflexota bacterium]